MSISHAVPTSDGTARPAPVVLRPSRPDDAGAIAAIYSWHVAHGTGTFELDPVDAQEILRRRDAVLASGAPWIVAEHDGRVLGYAYAAPFRARPAYRYFLEDSIYLAPEACGRGLGRLLLAELVARCEAQGARQLLAVIGDSANAASIGLHRALGFAPTGSLPSAGWKFGRWIDVVFMQRALGAGANTPPDESTKPMP